MAPWTRRLAGGQACAADVLPPAPPRPGSSCEPEICLDLLPRNRGLTVGDLGLGGFDVGQVLGGGDQTVEVVASITAATRCPQRVR